jgi:hypothetical protein
MSGNSSGGGMPSFNNPGAGDDCQNLVINTNLASPQAAIIENLSIGDILQVEAASEQGPIEVKDDQGNVAGTILTREQIRLLNCINSGTEYVAEVLVINDGQCSVQIRAI